MQLFCYHSNHEIEIWYCNSPVVYNTETILHWNAKRQHEIHLVTHKWLCLTGFKLVLKSIYDYPSIVVGTWYMIKTNCNICNIQQATRTAWTACSACGSVGSFRYIFLPNSGTASPVLMLQTNADHSLWMSWRWFYFSLCGFVEIPNILKKNNNIKSWILHIMPPLNTWI